MRIPEQEGTLYFQADVGVNLETTKTTLQLLAARQEFVKLSIRQQQRRTASIEQNKQFDPSR